MSIGARLSPIGKTYSRFVNQYHRALRRPAVADHTLKIVTQHRQVDAVGSGASEIVIHSGVIDVHVELVNGIELLLVVRPATAQDYEKGWEAAKRDEYKKALQPLKITMTAIYVDRRTDRSDQTADLLRTGCRVAPVLHLEQLGFYHAGGGQCLGIDTLKIDRSFVNQSLDSARTRSVISATIAIAHSLGIKTVAEGEESREQAEVLIAMDCNEIQGYFFCRPVEAEELRRRMAGFSLVPYAIRQGGR